MTVKIHITSVFVNDQSQALDFYTNKLGFQLKQDIDMGSHRWLTLVSKEDLDGTELLLEPSAHEAVKPYRDAIFRDGIPAASFQVTNLSREYERLSGLGVEFVQVPCDVVTAITATLDDTCGNLIQLIEMKNMATKS